MSDVLELEGDLGATINLNMDWASSHVIEWPGRRDVANPREKDVFKKTQCLLSYFHIRLDYQIEIPV